VVIIKNKKHSYEEKHQFRREKENINPERKGRNTKRGPMLKSQEDDAYKQKK
jgi:hypothetical protein